MMKLTVIGLLMLIIAAAIMWLLPTRSPSMQISSTLLQSNIEKYVDLGPHRSGGYGDQATRDWLAEELERAGFEVEIQSVPIRQWQHEEAYIAFGEARVAGFPYWWPPDTATQRNVTGILRWIGEAGTGEIAVLQIDPHLMSALRTEQLSLIGQAADRGVIGVVLLTETISDEPFAFNAPSTQISLPIIVVGSEATASVAQLVDSGEPVDLKIVGAYADVQTWNVVGRLSRKGEKTVAVSTPRTGWFHCGAERGPGVALFVETAKWAASAGEADLVFVATGGHEISHVGMNAFMDEGAPDPDQTKLWVHLGSSIAAFDWQTHGQRLDGEPTQQNVATRWIIYSGSMIFSVTKEFRRLGYEHSPAFISAFGEARDIKDAGYPKFIAFAGSHPYFHLPSDSAANTSGQILKPTALALQKVMMQHLE